MLGFSVPNDRLLNCFELGSRTSGEGGRQVLEFSESRTQKVQVRVQ